jgi:hypothetical protein
MNTAALTFNFEQLKTNKRNFSNKIQATSAATIARELILDGIERIGRMEAALVPDINNFDGVLTQELERGAEPNENAD